MKRGTCSRRQTYKTALSLVHLKVECKDRFLQLRLPPPPPSVLQLYLPYQLLRNTRSATPAFPSSQSRTLLPSKNVEHCSLKNIRGFKPVCTKLNRRLFPAPHTFFPPVVLPVCLPSPNTTANPHVFAEQTSVLQFLDRQASEEHEYRAASRSSRKKEEELEGLLSWNLSAGRQIRGEMFLLASAFWDDSRCDLLYAFRKGMNSMAKV